MNPRDTSWYIPITALRVFIFPLKSKGYKPSFLAWNCQLCYHWPATVPTSIRWTHPKYTTVISRAWSDANAKIRRTIPIWKVRGQPNIGEIFEGFGRVGAEGKIRCVLDIRQGIYPEQSRIWSLVNCFCILRHPRRRNVRRMLCIAEHRVHVLHLRRQHQSQVVPDDNERTTRTKFFKFAATLTEHVRGIASDTINGVDINGSA